MKLKTRIWQAKNSDGKTYVFYARSVKDVHENAPEGCLEAEQIGRVVVDSKGREHNEYLPGYEGKVLADNAPARETRK